jgi:hypothetical protein
MTKHLILIALSLALIAPSARADYIVNVTLDTSVLASNNPGQGSFAVDFQLNDGSGAGGDGNNTATITNFNLNGGSLTSGTDSSSGGASGNLGGTLAITDNSFFNDFNQTFTPGSSLSFTVDLTTNFSSAEASNFPDQFSFTVYSNGGTNTASFLTIDITGANPVVTTSGGSLGNGASVLAPSVQPAVATPEPSSLLLYLTGLLGLAGGAWRRRRRNG